MGSTPKVRGYGSAFISHAIRHKRDTAALFAFLLRLERSLLTPEEAEDIGNTGEQPSGAHRFSCEGVLRPRFVASLLSVPLIFCWRQGEGS